MRGEILSEAKAVINGVRQDAYGNPENNFETIAELWTIYTGHAVTAHDVAIMMVLLKIARIKTGVGTKDSYVDAAGYIALANDMTIIGE